MEEHIPLNPTRNWAAFQNTYDKEFWRMQTVENDPPMADTYARDADEAYYKPSPAVTLENAVTWDRTYHRQMHPWLFHNGKERVRDVDIYPDLRNYATFMSLYREIITLMIGNDAAHAFIRAKMYGLLNAEVGERAENFGKQKFPASPYRGSTRTFVTSFPASYDQLEPRIARAVARYFNPLTRPFTDVVDDKAVLSCNKSRHYLAFYLTRYDLFTFIYFLLRIILDADNAPAEFTVLFNETEDVVLSAMLSFEQTYVLTLRHFFAELNPSDLPMEPSQYTAQRTLDDVTNIAEKRVLIQLYKLLTLTDGRLHSIYLRGARTSPYLMLTYTSFAGYPSPVPVIRNIQWPAPSEQKQEEMPVTVKTPTTVGPGQRVYVLLYIIQQRLGNVKTRLVQNEIVKADTEATKKVQEVEGIMYFRGKLVAGRATPARLTTLLDAYLLDLKKPTVTFSRSYADELQLAMGSHWDLLSFVVYFIKFYVEGDIQGTPNPPDVNRFNDAVQGAEEQLDKMYEAMIDLTEATDEEDLYEAHRTFQNAESKFEKNVVDMLLYGHLIMSHDPAQMDLIFRDIENKNIDWIAQIASSVNLESSVTTRQGKRK